MFQYEESKLHEESKLVYVALSNFQIVTEENFIKSWKFTHFFDKDIYGTSLGTLLLSLLNIRLTC